MLSIWPINQPMSRVAEFACCAILDFRSPSGNDNDNRKMPSGMSEVARPATVDRTAKAGLLETGVVPAGTGNPGETYRPGNLPRKTYRHFAFVGTGTSFGMRRRTNLPLPGKASGQSGNG